MIQMPQNALLRESVPQDAPQLERLWCDAFGDPPELVRSFLSLLPGMGRACVAERDGQILGAAYLVDGLTLLRPGCSPLHCGYLYAVAVDPAARGHGLGAAVSRGAAELGRQRGSELICTLPAEDSLYSWYGRIMGLTYQSTRRIFFSDSLPESLPLSPSDYLARREAILQALPHVRPNVSVMEFEAKLCSQYGGGLYAAGDALFFAYPEQGRWVIPELLPLSSADCFPGIQLQSRPYLCADRPLPDGMIWNLTFD